MKKELTLLIMMLLGLVSYAADNEEEVYVNYQGLRFHRTKVQSSYSHLGGGRLTVYFSLALPDSGQYAGDIVIPQKIPYHYEKDIADPLYEGVTHHVETDSANVTRAEFSFWGNEEITSVSYPAVFEIGSFQNCTNLTAVVLPSQTASYSPGTTTFDQMPPGMFKGCEKLLSVANFDKFEKIRESTFEGCKKLKDVDLTNVTIIEGRAFYGCESQDSITLPNIKEVNYSAFYGCTSLEFIEFGNQFKLLGTGIFEECVNLTTVKGMEKMLNTRPSYYTVPQATFKNCKRLENIMFPDVDLQIGESAFEGCERLKIIGGAFTIEKNIGKAAFKGCDSLETLPVDWKQRHAYNESVFSGCHHLNFGDTVITAKIFKGAFNECYKLNAVKSFFEEIADSAFCNCTNLSYFSLEQGVTLSEIGEKAFYNCSNLSALKCWLSDVGDQSFEGCKKLSSIVFATGRYNDDSSFSLVVPNLKLGNRAFADCRNLGRITFYASHGSYGENVFEGCDQIRDVYIASGVIIGEPEMFSVENCAYATLHIVGDNTVKNLVQHFEKLGWNMFKTIKTGYFDYVYSPVTHKNEGSKYIYNDERFYTMENGALACYDNVDYYIPMETNEHHVTIIGSKAFKDNHWVETIHLPISIKYIDSLAFDNCQELKGIYVRRTRPIYYSNGLWFEENRMKRPFEGIDFDSCTLYVPKYCSYDYRWANEWKRFKHIVETDDEGGIWNPPGEHFGGGGSGSNPLDQIIEFDDPLTEDICIEHWDTNETDALSYREAKAVNDIGTVFQGTNISAFCELQYFTGLTAIPENAFLNCVELDSISIPNSVKSIGNRAFAGCNAMTKVISLISEPFAFNDNVFTQTAYSTATLVVPTGTKAKYQATPGWKNFFNIIEEGDEHDPVIPGDLSADGEVNSTDLVILVNMIMGRQTKIAAADLNGDGEVNSTDLVMLVNKIMNK